MSFRTIKMVVLIILYCNSVVSQGRSLLLSNDFEHSTIKGYRTLSVSGHLKLTNTGTIDRYMGSPGQALEYSFFGAMPDSRHLEGFTTQLYPVDLSEKDRAKLTLGFDLWTSEINPVQISIKCYDRTGKLSCVLSKLVVPPVANAFFRSTTDLDEAVATTGKYAPAIKKVQFAFEVSGNSQSVKTKKFTMKLDNITFTQPAYYVSPNGNDTNNGYTERSAFTTLQKAANMAKPGDVIIVLPGTYHDSNQADISDIPDSAVNNTAWRPWWVKKSGSIVTVSNTGSPSGWITIRGYPKHQATLSNSRGWQAIKIDTGIAYIEVRDLVIKGNTDGASLDSALHDGSIQETNGRRYTGNPVFNGSGIMVDGRASSDPARRPHHLRFINNIVHHNPSAGISVIGAGYVDMEGNVAYHNCHFGRYGASGLSFLNASNYDTTTNHNMFIIGNTAYKNECFVPWARYRKGEEGKYLPDPLSDGNGIIVDVNIRSNNGLTYKGRTLVSNNLSFGNGGGGIVVTTARGVDIINNTLFRNLQTPDLKIKGWGDLFIGGPKPGSNDIKVVNNIVVNDSCPLKIHTTTKTLVENNLFFGTHISEGDVNINNVNADPLFEDPGLNPTKASFKLLKNSPARKAGKIDCMLVPVNDIKKNIRLKDTPVDLGAYNMDN